MNTVDPLTDLRHATCSNGAPSARNLIVTVFGDALLPYGPDTAVPVRQLAQLLSSFAVNERLVRTSLSRLVHDGLLAVHQQDRRSSYRVAPDALTLFADADRRIYRGATTTWDGSWTVVVIDAAEGSAADRAQLRQELAWAGLGVVAPNVMASPTVDPEVAASVVARSQGVDSVLVSRSQVVESAHAIDAEELARRCAPLDDTADRYRSFVDRFQAYDGPTLAALEPADAFKLRILVVAAFRRIVLADPLLPNELLPSEWVGHLARELTARIYAAIAGASERFVTETTGLEPAVAVEHRFEPPTEGG